MAFVRDMDGCALWLSSVTVVGGGISLLFLHQLCCTTVAESRNSICGLPMKRVMQILGVLGSWMFMAGWSISAVECVFMAPPPTLLSRASIKFCLDGLSVMFVLQYVLGTTTFLNAIAMSSRSRNSGKPPLLFVAGIIVTVWLVLDIYQVCVNRQWVTALFYWWLMASLWGVFIYFHVVAHKLVTLLQQEAKPPTQGLLRQGDASHAEEWEEQARKAQKVVRKVRVLLISTAGALLLASWYWVMAGRTIVNLVDRSLTELHYPEAATFVFCVLHAFGLLICCWWVWQPADKNVCERRQRVLRTTHEPSEWFDTVSVTAQQHEERSASISVCESPHSLNSAEQSNMDRTNGMMPISASTRVLNTWGDRSAKFHELTRGSNNSTKTCNTI